MSKQLKIITDIKNCRICEGQLPHKPRPVVSFSLKSKIIIIGQAPGSKVHESGIPWDDSSGVRLREWLGVKKEQFYNINLFGIVPMGFCYPGKGKSGDLPPRPECATQWMELVLKNLKERKIILLIGQYSQEYFLKDRRKENLTKTVQSFEKYLPQYFVLPHPSPRNNIWMEKNKWFEKKVIPKLKVITHQLIK